MKGSSNGFSTACLAASADERVMVMTKAVLANPMSSSTATLPFQPVSSFSSIATEPRPMYERRATAAYVGRAPKSVTNTTSAVATGERTPAARNAMPGW